MKSVGFMIFSIITFILYYLAQDEINSIKIKLSEQKNYKTENMTKR